MSQTSVRVENAGPGWLRLIPSVLDTESEVLTRDLESFLLDANGVYDLIHHLLVGIRPDSLAQYHQAGNCARCQNTRLIDILTPAGRPSNTRCPDCSEAFYTPVPPLLPYFQVPQPEEQTPAVPPSPPVRPNQRTGRR